MSSVNDEMISVIDAAGQLGRRKQVLFKVMRRLGIHVHKRRDTARRNQLISYLSEGDFTRSRRR